MSSDKRGSQKVNNNPYMANPILKFGIIISVSKITLKCFQPLAGLKLEEDIIIRRQPGGVAPGKNILKNFKE